MKRIFTVLLLLCCLCLAGCGKVQTDNGKLKITATVFPLYDWTANILDGLMGNDGSAELKMLVSGGKDIHSYQPSAADIITISSSDVFIYVGGESDAWVADALKNAVNKDMIVVNLLDVLGDLAKEEAAPEGSDEGNGEHGSSGHDEDEEYDEHIWLSLKNAAVCCRAIADALKAADGKNAGKYEENLKTYTAKLDDLQKEYEKAMNGAPVKTLLFGDRFPFRYLCDDYGISYYAAFSGCSAETEASFKTLTFLVEKLDGLNLGPIMITDTADGSIARSINESSKTKDHVILTLDSLQSVTDKEISSGTTYLSVMEQNLGVLKEALK